MKDVKFPEITTEFLTYCFFVLGHHSQSFFDHVFIKERQSDYREMLLHHIACVLVFSGYLLANLYAIGAFLTWIHDISDMFIAASRFCNSCGLDKTMAVLFIGVLTSWFMTRLSVMPLVFYILATKVEWEENPYYANWRLLELIYLGTLQLLHVYWGYMLLDMGLKFVRSGKAVDTVNDQGEFKQKSEKVD